MTYIFSNRVMDTEKQNIIPHFCPRCGARIQLLSALCPICGRKFFSESSTSNNIERGNYNVKDIEHDDLEYGNEERKLGTRQKLSFKNNYDGFCLSCKSPVVIKGSPLGIYFSIIAFVSNTILAAFWSSIFVLVGILLTIMGLYLQAKPLSYYYFCPACGSEKKIRKYKIEAEIA